MSDLSSQVACRRTFAIISHPDAGKTTLTEKLLLYGGAIRQAGSVKARRAERHATSDWMEHVGSGLDRTVKDIIRRIAIDSTLRDEHSKQKRRSKCCCADI